MIIPSPPSHCPICSADWEHLDHLYGTQYCSNLVCRKVYQTTRFYASDHSWYVAILVKDKLCHYMYDGSFRMPKLILHYHPPYPTLDNASHIETLINFQ